MDSHFHGNDKRECENDIKEVEIATGSTQVILSAPLAMTLQIINPYLKGRSCLIYNPPGINGWFYPVL